MTPKIRNILQGLLFIILIGLTIVLGYQSYIETNTSNFIGTISLLIAIFSFIITTITLNQNYDSKLPQIIVDVDFGSRYGLLILKITNLGDKTAYDIKIRWNHPLKNHKGEVISTLGEIENQMNIPVLQKGQEIKITIDEITDFFKKYSDSELSFDGNIKLKLSKNSKFKLSQGFSLNLVPYRKTLYHDNEQIKAFYELQKIPTKLDALINEIKKQGPL